MEFYDTIIRRNNGEILKLCVKGEWLEAIRVVGGKVVERHRIPASSAAKLVAAEADK